MKAHLLLIAAPLCLAFAGAAQAQDSSASATLSFNVVTSSPSGLTWLQGDSYSLSEASAASFEAWESDYFGGFSPRFGTLSTQSDLKTGLWVNTTSALATSQLNFNSSFSFAPTLRNASLQSTASVINGGIGNGLAFVRSYFSLAPGASVTFSGNLTLSVFGNNQSFPSNYTTTDLYGNASGLMAIGTDTGSALEIGNATLPYTAGAYSFNQVAPLSVSFSNTGITTVTAYLDSGVAVYTASAVPEPETYALMLAGLAAIGFMVRRRSST